MATPNFSALLPDVALNELNELTKALGINRTQVVIRAIHNLYKQEIKTMNTQPNYEQLAKERVNTDDDLGPEKDILLDYEWDNMTEHYEWVATAPKPEILSWVLAIRDAENAVATNAEGE